MLRNCPKIARWCGYGTALEWAEVVHAANGGRRSGGPRGLVLSVSLRIFRHGSDETNGGEDPSRCPYPHTPNVGFRAPTNQVRFELKGVCEELNLPSLPSRRSHILAR